MKFLNGATSGRVGSFAVLGLGIFGATVARELMNYGNHVIGVDGSDTRVNALANDLTHAVMADVRDDAALREAGVGECQTALIAIGGDLEASILAAINVRSLGVKQVWAKASSKTHHRILSKLNVDRVIHPELEVGQQIAQVLHNPTVRDYAPLGNGFYMVDFVVPEALQGRQLAELTHQKFHLRCLGAMRGTEYLGSDGTAIELRADDKLILLGRRSALRAFADSVRSR